MKAPGFAAAACLILAGCAAPVYESRYPYERGWRVGKVLAVGDPASFGDKFDVAEDCRPELPTHEGKMALVRFYREGRPRLRLAIVAPDRPVEALASVYVNADDCRVAVVPETHKGEDARQR